MRMEEIVKVYSLGRTKIAEKYAQALVEREKCMKAVERGVVGGERRCCYYDGC